ncbi:metallophosphoesterase family protein [Janibacter alittae]|uniref:Metallophosphoesterase n=1 Tax=Janibacter alittae TaxID=3115209 RepID=A0ABZ2MGR3_9MICO
MRWTAALRPAAAALLVAAATLTGGLTVATLWPVSVETTYYAADVRLSPVWEQRSSIGAETVVGGMSAEFDGFAPGIRVEPRIKPEITDLVESGDLDLSTLTVDGDERQRLIGEAGTGIGLRFLGGAVLGLGLVALGTGLYRRGVPSGRTALGAALVAAVTCAGAGLATQRTYTPERLAALHSSGLLEMAVANRGLFGDVRHRTDQAAPYLRNLLALSNAVQAEYAPVEISDDSALKVLLVSDIHSANQYSLMRMIVQEQDIDVVIDSGDLINFGHSAEAQLTNLNQGIASLGVPYVFVRGNHDALSPDDTALIDRLSEVDNVYLVEPKPGDYQQVSIGGLRIAGFNDPRTFGHPASEEMHQKELEARDAWVEALGDGQVPDLTVAHNPQSLEDAPGRLRINGHMHIADLEDNRIQVGTFTGAGNLRRFTWNTDGERLGQPSAFDVLTFDDACQAKRLTRYEYRSVIEGRPTYDSVSVLNAGRVAEPAQEGRTCGGDSVEVEPLGAPAP